ncbi:MAG: Haloacid dehalogenase domain protein hydrolase, partial [Solirubrobacterales bacterium]|nr:Haloacid dehalogenase domain protein hydrolase [Solirubrobacterales bacterium]
MSAPLLVLFDIDGTLLGGATDAHVRALHDALQEVHGVAEPWRVRVEAAGRTDGEIARAILLGHGLSAERIDARADDVREACCRFHAELLVEDLSHTVLPGVLELLTELDSADDVQLALLTGNFEPVARRKLKQAGIGRFFPSGQGAFGSDGEDRAALPAIARRRASRHPRERTVIVGDTPRDIACARADEIGCVAVATGSAPASELARADAVCADARGVA